MNYTSWNHFIYCLNYLRLDWPNFVPLSAKLFLGESAFIIRTCLTFRSDLRYRKLLPIFYTTLHQSKMILLVFFILWHALILPFCWIQCYNHQFFKYLFYMHCVAYMLWQAGYLTWLNIGSQSSKFSSSTLVLLRFMLIRAI